MKSIVFLTLLTVVNVNFKLLPEPTLMAVMGVVIIMDFLSGVVKATMNDEVRTSEGYRKTIIKFMQYGGALCVGKILGYLAVYTKDANTLMIIPYINYLNNGLLIFIIFIELTSILENLYAIDDRSLFAIYFIKPLLRVMTFAIKNNTIAKQAKSNQKEESLKN